MTQLSGSITIEGGRLERAIAEAVATQTNHAIAEAVRPVLAEVRRLAALAEAQMVGRAEAAKILVSAGATLDISQAQAVVDSLSRLGYRFTLVDPNAATAEHPIVPEPSRTWNGPSGESRNIDPATGAVRDPALWMTTTNGAGLDKDTSWTSKFE
jgi:hypothetical protein